METYQEMSEQIVGILRLRGDCDPVMLYAAARIEELENSLAHCDAGREVAMKLAVEFGGQLENEHQVAKKAEAVLASAIDELQACRLHNTELERQLREAQATAQVQSDAVQCHWLSPAEAEGLRQQLQEVEKALAIAMDALEHCETAAPDLTGNVLDVIEERLTPVALARLSECAREVCA